MMKRLKLWFFLLLLSVIAAACDSKAETASMEGAVPSKNQNGTDSNIREEHYKKDGIDARYPFIISGGTEEERRIWNQIIDTDFDKILQIYSFNPFPELTPKPTAEVPTILKIDNSVKLNNDKFLSVFYLADFSSSYSAHPTELAYSTNIDKEKDEQIRLSDIVKLNSDFVQNFREWEFIPTVTNNKEFNAMIKEHMLQMSDEDLLAGFQSADQIGSKNIWGIYSYLTPDRVGISVSVPNYLGDHVEFEREYSQLEDFLKINKN